jgi:hypothetical protein
MANSSLITLTEITNNRRAATMREKGWAYYNSKKNNGEDNCGTCWDTTKWKRGWAGTRKLNNHVFYRLNGKHAEPIYSSSVILIRKDSGHKLLVSVTHMPAHVEGAHQWRTQENQWKARKAAYLSSLKNWSSHVKDLVRKHKPDGVLIVADWNLNLKEDWVRELLKDHWGKEYKQAWKKFPHSGGSLGGNRIIDGSLYRRLKVVDAPELLPKTASSDHRPYEEQFRFLTKGEVDDLEEDAEGNTTPGEVWWGFGDYEDDELYHIPTVYEDAKP